MFHTQIRIAEFNLIPPFQPQTVPWILRDGQTVIAREFGLFDLEQPGHPTLRDLTYGQVLDVLQQRNGGAAVSQNVI